MNRRRLTPRAAALFVAPLILAVATALILVIVAAAALTTAPRPRSGPCRPQRRRSPRR